MQYSGNIRLAQDSVLLPLVTSVAGVRIMDANANQGRRVNYMNKSGQTVDPKSGQTISNKDPRGHIPYGN